MFYYLTSSGDTLNLFRYITFRAGGALVTALAIYLVFGSRFIAWAQRFAQPIRKEGPQSHLKKAGTPTMGGLLLLGAAATSAMLWSNLQNGYVWIMLFAMTAFGAIGLADDYIKVKKGNAYRGLSAALRLALQFALAGAISWGVQSLMPTELKTSLLAPFFKNFIWDMGIIYFAFASTAIVGTANAVNLTDGLDGLAGATATSAFAVFLIVSYLMGRADYSLYLLMPYVPGAGEIAIVAGAVIGAILGFLWFNAYPARIFMGDVGSLGIGAALGTAAVICKSELLLVICGGIFVAEALSVMIQIASFKWRNRRVFKMAPLHHHFELSGWSEQQVLMRFWIVSILLALLALSSLKIR